MTREIQEKFGVGLTRVLKKVQRGGKTVKQAFHVKQAAPGDQYAAPKGPAAKAASVPQEQPQPAPDSTVEDPNAQPVEAEQPVMPVRMTVRFHDVPWKAKDREKDEDPDPIPPLIRKRFEKGSKTISTVSPDVAGFPVITVVPTDRVLWGADEPDLLLALRAGSIKKMRLAGGGNGMMVAKIEPNGGGSYYAYMWMESLRCPLLKQLWGDIIDFSVNDGPLSRRCACAYETSKACGLDDLTPPTVHRTDMDGDLISMLPDSLIEQAAKSEWVSGITGKDPEVVRSEIGKHASVQLIKGELWPIESEEWFRNLFGTTNTEAMNNIWEVMPPDRRIAFLRTAALDFVIGNLDRSFGDIIFSDDPRRPMMVFGGELSMTCPRVIGLAYAQGGYGSYADTASNAPGAIPLLWSEPATMLAVRGGDPEISDFEGIGISISSRMRGDRPKELARSLLEHKATPLQMSGILSRIWMMETFSKDIAKDPYFAARYYASILGGRPDPGMDGVRDFVNNTMRLVLVREFDFYSEMRSGDQDEDAA